MGGIERFIVDCEVKFKLHKGSIYKARYRDMKPCLYNVGYQPSMTYDFPTLFSMWVTLDTFYKQSLFIIQ